MDNVKYKDKIVVITGAASGIGAAFVKYFADRGAKIVLLDMQKDGILSLIQELEIQDVDCLVTPLDITREEHVKHAFEDVIKKFKKIDILINNAGISQISLFENTSLEIFKKVMDVNFYGTVYCTKYALPHLQRSKGQIIALSSVAGFSPLYGRTAYSASKHALHGFLNSLRTEEKENGVDVLLACPSFVKTNIEKRTFNEEGKPFGEKKGIPGHLMTPEFVVLKIMKGVRKKKNVVYISGISKISRLFSFFFPKIFERKMTEKVKADF
ncbi:MAG: SDR family oxidoreductase [Bacteroidota bacterium]